MVLKAGKTHTKISFSVPLIIITEFMIQANLSLTATLEIVRAAAAEDWHL